MVMIPPQQFWVDEIKSKINCGSEKVFNKLKHTVGLCVCDKDTVSLNDHFSFPTARYYGMSHPGGGCISAAEEAIPPIHTHSGGYVSACEAPENSVK
uniref:Uncharacterized protein n=1 Tax=Chrysemys picta bellii TaxID=8478 RepID=A0A8C3P8H6_CHRPI